MIRDAKVSRQLAREVGSATLSLALRRLAPNLSYSLRDSLASVPMSTKPASETDGSTLSVSVVMAMVALMFVFAFRFA